MASKAVKTVAKAVAEYQYPWKEKLAKHKNELCKGVWGYWNLGAWTPLHISGRRRARLRKEVLLAGEDWPYDPERKEMRTKMKGHKCDRIAAERRANTAKLMEQMPEMLLAYKKRSCCQKIIFLSAFSSPGRILVTLTSTLYCFNVLPLFKETKIECFYPYKLMEDALSSLLVEQN
ncbi:hypothetical protein SADUNF_Sadunf15G0011700 [Salix dunnii]|uniref:Uncharacterized protein n=1 Tax=Salix dunnii TaxID=1413687 RepID=A0A835JDE1_9ROSI|nr:hypothetical protein SADUNF_Sadunf15G0011700 [Salix dunnii]